MSKFNHKIGGHAPVFYTPQPYFLKHQPLNPYLGSQHDGVTADFLKGYSVKPMHWLYRFRYNTNSRAAPPMYLRNPLGKDIHWLEVSIIEKFRLQLVNWEAWPHVCAAVVIIGIVAWQFYWYMYCHPELSLYNIAIGQTKNYVKRERYNDKIEIDQPVFRWFQRCPEFYGYDSYRELIKLGVIANDPYIEFVKSHGRERELTLYCNEKGWGEGGQGKLDSLLAKRRADREKKKHDEILLGKNGHDDHAAGHDAHH